MPFIYDNNNSNKNFFPSHKPYTQRLVLIPIQVIFNLITNGEYGVVHRTSSRDNLYVFTIEKFDVYIRRRNVHIYQSANCICQICDRQANYFIAKWESRLNRWYLHLAYVTDTKKGKKVYLYNIDHIRQRRLGGRNSLNNLRTTCKNCNTNRETPNKFEGCNFAAGRAWSVVVLPTYCL